MATVPVGVPMFSEKIVFVVPPPPEDKIVIVRLVLLTPTEFEAEMVTTFVPAVGVAPEISPLFVLTLAQVGKFEAVVGLVMTGGAVGTSAVTTTSSTKARLAVVSTLIVVAVVPPVKLKVLVSNSPVMTAA